MIVYCPNCNKRLKCNEKMLGKSAKCPGCGFLIEIYRHNTIQSKEQVSNQTQESNKQTTRSFLARLFSSLKSKRNVVYRKIDDKLFIKFFIMPSHEIKKNWPMLLFLVIGFGVLPIVLGFFQVLLGLIQGHEENEYVQVYMYFLLVFYLMPPIFIYLKLIIPMFTIRTVILDSYKIIIKESFFGKRSKVKLTLPKQRIKTTKWSNTSFFEKIQQVKNEKLFLVYDKGKTEIISTYPEHDLLRIQQIFSKYISGDTIDKVQAESDHVQKNIEEKEEKVYPIYKLIFFHIIGKKDVKLAPLNRYLDVNAAIGAFGLFSLIMGFVFGEQIKETVGEPDMRYTIIQAMASIILVIGWLLNKIREIPRAINEQLLNIGGLIIFSYICFMLYHILPGIKETYESASGISHSPGIITFLVSYGFWLICEFGPLKVIYKTSIGQWLPRLVFVVAAAIDLYILYLVITIGSAKMNNFMNESRKIMEDSTSAK